MVADVGGIPDDRVKSGGRSDIEEVPDLHVSLHPMFSQELIGEIGRGRVELHTGELDLLAQRLRTGGGRE
ncbi:hypothetical protein ACJ65_07710 [Kocuria rhizophila]|nr:hypothetical protein ACJ65_07710 [Kocuria rhizophila]